MASVVAADMIADMTAAPRHLFSAFHMVAEGREGWGNICEMLDKHIWESLDGPNASIIQQAILHGDSLVAKRYLDPSLEPELLASLSILPSRHIGMIEELFAVASRRAAP